MSIEAMKKALAKFEHLWEIGIDAEYKVELLPEIEALRQAIEQAEYDNLTVKFGERAKEYLVEAKKSWQEPFGYFQLDLRMDAWVQNRDNKKGVPFYTAPPKREWVGLTDEEIKGILDCGRGGLVDIKKAEQILKERNA